MTTTSYAREGPITAADTRTALTTLGSQTAPGLIKTASSDARISYLVATVASATATTTTDGGVVFVRIGGAALDKEYVVMLGCRRNQMSTAGQNSDTGYNIVIPLPIPLKVPGEYIELYAEMAGVEASDPNVLVALICE